MQKHDPFGDVWSMNALKRATIIGQRTYSRTLERRVEWPKLPQQNIAKNDPVSYTTLEEAFETVQQFMAQTSRQCLKYHRSHPPREHQEMARHHCDRFHTPRYTQYVTDKGQSRCAEPGCSGESMTSYRGSSQLQEGRKHCRTCYCAYLQ